MSMPSTSNPPAALTPVEVFQILEGQYFRLETRWRLYRQIFGARKWDITLLRDYLGAFAQILKETQEENLALRIYALLDRRNDVISLWDLCGRPNKSSSPPKKGSLQFAVAKIESLARNVILHRHKLHAHLDSQRLALGVPLPAVSAKELGEMVRRIGKLIDRVRKVQQPGVATHEPNLLGDGKLLLLQLRRLDAMIRLIKTTKDVAVKRELKAIFESHRATKTKGSRQAPSPVHAP